MVSLIDIKERARRAIHGKLAVPITSFKDGEHPEGLTFGVLLPLTVRYHNKISRSGDLNGDYAEVIEGVDRLIFHEDNLAEVNAALVLDDEPPIVLSRGAELLIERYQGLRFVLDSLEPPDGPGEQVWVVARLRA